MRKSFFHNKLLLTILFFLRAAGGLLTVAFAFILQRIVDVAVLADYEALGKVSILSIGFCVALTLLYFFIMYLSSKYINKSILILRNTFLDNLIFRNLHCWGTVDSAKYLSALTNDVQNVSQHYYQNLLALPDDVVSITASFIAVMLYNYIVGLTMLGLTIFMAIIPALLKNKLDKNNLLLSKRNSEYVEKTKEVVNGINEIKSYEAEHIFQAKTHVSAEKICKSQNTIAKLVMLISQSSTFISNILQLGIMCLSAYFVIINQLTVGAIIAIFALLSKFYYPIQSLADRIVGIMSMQSVSKELDTVLKQEKVIEKNCLNCIEKIELQNVNYSYTGKEPFSVVNFNATFEKKGKYLILGESGSGKSTILKLLHKELIPYGGNIMFNGIELSSIKDSEIFSKTATVKQDNFLFNTDIYNNVDMLGKLSNVEIDKILELTKLKDFASALQHRNYVIDEEVSQVSGGEKARINFARAIAKKAEVLLLDEVTAAMDKALAVYMENLILSQDAMVINVSHRFDLSNIDMYDRIIIMEKGHIIANDIVSEIKKTNILDKYRSVDTNETF